MILGKDFNWYLKIIQNTLLIVAGWIIFSGMIGKIPLIGWAFNLFTGPVTWLLKLGGAGYVGYQTVKKFQGTNSQSLASGGILGAGIGLVSMVMSFLRLLMSRSAAGLLFGVFGLVAVVISEAVTGLILGFLGGLIAGTKNPETK